MFKLKVLPNFNNYSLLLTEVRVYSKLSDIDWLLLMLILVINPILTSLQNLTIIVLSNFGTHGYLFQGEVVKT